VQTAGVGRAHCLTPGSRENGAQKPPPGHVVMLILPSCDAEQAARVGPDQLTLKPELAESVQSRLENQRLLGTTVEVRSPRVMWVSVNMTLRVARRTDLAVMEEARVKAEDLLYRYLNPYTGGPTGAGWPLGRDLNRAELLGLVQRIPEVEYADNVRVTVAEAGAASVPVTAAQHLVVPFDAILCSGEHNVRVDVARDEG